MREEVTGMASRSANSRSSREASARTTPPPAMITGLLASPIIAAALSTSWSEAIGRDSFPSSSRARAEKSTSMTAFCRSTGRSIRIGPIFPEEAILKARWIRVGISWADRGKKALLVIGPEMATMGAS
jgi:hypothetical protein